MSLLSSKEARFSPAYLRPVYKSTRGSLFAMASTGARVTQKMRATTVSSADRCAATLAARES
jgi:hypothetical protein